MIPDAAFMRIRRRLLKSGFPANPRVYAYQSVAVDWAIYQIYDEAHRCWLDVGHAAMSALKSNDGNHLKLVLDLACAVPRLIEEIRLLRSDNRLLREALHANGIGQEHKEESS